MDSVTIHAAKTNLSQLLARVESGEEIIIARGKNPVAKLVPFHPRIPKRQFGSLRGTISVGPDGLDPLPEEALATWE
jgi:prevent-host-death family protein